MFKKLIFSKVTKAKVVSIVLSMMLVLSLVGYTPTVQASSGAWVLVETKYKLNSQVGEYVAAPGKVTERDGDYAADLTASRQGLQIIVSSKGFRSTDPPRNMNVSYSWNAPPSTIQAGARVSVPINITATATQTGGHAQSFDTLVRYGTADTNLRPAVFSLDGRNYNYLSISHTPNRATGMYYSTLSPPRQITYNFDFAGAGTVGQRMAIEVTTQATFLAWAGEYYVYEWQAVSSVPSQPVAPTTGNAWVLVETKYKLNSQVGEYVAAPGKVTERDGDYAADLTASRQGLQIIVASKGFRSTDPPRNMNVSYSWNAPPSTIQAGARVSVPINITATATQTGGHAQSFDTLVRYGTADTNLRPAEFSLDGRNYNYLSISHTPNRATGMHYSTLSPPRQITYNFDFAGAGTVGQRMAIEVTTQATFLAWAGEYYVYEWQAASSTPTQPTPVEPTRPSTPSTPSGFSDLAKSHWAYNTVMEMVELGILSGYPDGTFRPQNTISRAEFAKIMVLTLDIPTSRPSSGTFTDVPSSHWAYDVIESSRDYLTGYRNTQTGVLTFAPGEVAVREDVAVAIVKANGFGNTTGDSSLLARFPDVNLISPALRNHVAIAVEKGYMQGSNIGFEPKKALTRAEACALLSRLLDRSSVNQEKITF